MTVRFTYGCMRVGKTAHLLDSVMADKDAGYLPVVYRPAYDTRTRSGIVKSRRGDSYRSITANARSDFESSFSTLLYTVSDKEKLSVFIDEVQFLTAETVKFVIEFAQSHNLKLNLYGLLTDADQELFSASSVCMALCDETHEITSNCERCGAANGRFMVRLDGNPSDSFRVGDRLYQRICSTCLQREKEYGDRL